MRLEPLEDRWLLSAFDFGDAPDPGYPTLLASDGARHEVGTLWLGSLIDAEPNGQPNATAAGDDLAGQDDEEGVVFLEPLTPGEAAGIRVTASAAGRLDTWIDLNRDGDWNDADEHFLVSRPVAAGANSFVLFVPPGAVPGTTYARFRISSSGGLAPTGLAADGEVEDCAVEIVAPSGEIRGVCWEDWDADGQRDPGERAIAGWTVYVDQNSNGQPDSGEPSRITASDNPDTPHDETGEYSFTGLAAGSHRVMEIVPPGWGQTSPHFQPGIACVSTSSEGAFSDERCHFSSLSSDGRHVAFYSYSSGLVPGDTNGVPDGFLYDRQTRTMERISVAADGSQANDHTWCADVNGDGRYVAFTSLASNLVPGDTNGTFDVFVRDRQTGSVERVSVNDDGSQRDDRCSMCVISADGRFVAYDGRPKWLGSGDLWNVFVYDRSLHTLRCVSVASDGTPGNQHSNGPVVISADGRYVAFRSWATNFVAGDTNGVSQVFVYDCQAQALQCVSRLPGGDLGNGDSLYPSISGDGRFVAFQSEASNFLAEDLNPYSDVFLYDRLADQLECVDVNNDGVQANSESCGPSVSGDGRFVAFQSGASNLPGNGYAQIYIRDRQAGTTQCVSVSAGGEPGNSSSSYTAISPDGRYVAFESADTNLVPRTPPATGWRVFVNSTTAQVSSDARAVVIVHGGTGEANLGNLPAMDYGDALDWPYATLLAHDGARHAISGLRLGASVDAETDGRPTPLADGDNDDGVALNRWMMPGETVPITVTASASGLLDAWIDFDRDGDWEPAEQVLDGQPVVAGGNELTAAVPQGVTFGATIARFRLSSAGGLSPQGPALDGEVEDYEVYLVNPLGAVDFRALDDQDATRGDLWYSFRTVRKGSLDIETAWPMGSGVVEATLYDAQLTELGRSNYKYYSETEYVLDIAWEESLDGGQQYFLKLTATHAANCDLRIGNLVVPEPGRVVIYGTEEEDLFTLTATPGNPSNQTKLDFRINGIRYWFFGSIWQSMAVAFDGAGGGDTARIEAMAASETATMSPGAAVVTSPQYSVDVSSVADIEVAGGGDGSVILNGSAGDDTYVATAGTAAELTGAGYRLSAKAFPDATVRGNGGDDTATMNDCTLDDTFTASPQTAVLSGPGYTNTVEQMPNIYVYARKGGHDVAYLEGGSGKDKIKFDANVAWMYGGNYYVRAKFFDEVRANGKGGTTDTAIFYDTPAADVLAANPNVTSVSTGALVRKATGFENVTVYGTSIDTATLGDSPGDDIFNGLAHKSYMYGPGYKIVTRGFKKVTATASTGFDKARLYDTAFDDHYECRPGESKVTGGGTSVLAITALGFDKVSLVANQGGVDRADLYDTEGNDRLDASGTLARLYRNAAVLELLYETLSVEQVTAHGSTGANTHNVTLPLAFDLIFDGNWVP